MPCELNFNYYTSETFNNDNDIIECFNGKNSFSALNCNIRSLSANYDNLVNLLSELASAFSLIGLTETKIKLNQDPIVNTKLSGYNFLSQPTYSNAGGVGFYIKEDLEFTVRDDLTISKNEFEALWIELYNDSQHNMICGIIYRHPDGNVETFQEYLNSTIEWIHRENKYCMIMGDFNLDLLKFEHHPATDHFINTLGTSFFHPHILQPTRITDHSATLIDNIFFNSLEHFTISGNIIYDLTDHLPNFLIINKFPPYL